MNAYVLVLAGLGALTLLTAWLPMLLRQAPLSLPIICVGIGAALFSLPLPGEPPLLNQYPKLTERLTELVVIVALMGAGLKLDQPLNWARGQLAWRLLGLAMPITILSLTVLGSWLLQLGIAAALLLAAALAPTDPVLASDVQVGPPKGGMEDEVRYTLTAEAGLNDGLAFPFVNLAIVLALTGTVSNEWLLRDVIWKLVVGLAMGWVIGRILGWLMFHMPNAARLSRTRDGFVALGVTFISYSLTELAAGYGFLAVFITALGIRSAERQHEYHEKLHEFIEQLERLLMMILLVLFGGALVTGLLNALTWPGVLYALITILVVRPLAGWASLAGAALSGSERNVISFFGIRGVGTVYYLAYAFTHAKFGEFDFLWSVAGLIILLSILIHGAAVTPVMNWLDRRAGRDGAV